MTTAPRTYVMGRDDMEHKSAPAPVPVRIREVLADEQEINYILKTWCREQRHQYPAHLPDRIFYQRQQALIGRLASRSICKIACCPDMLSSIYGFAVGKQISPTTTLLHYVYVRQEWQRLGIGRGLLEALGWRKGMEIICTQWDYRLNKWIEPIRGNDPNRPRRTDGGKVLRYVHFPYIVYEPFLLQGFGDPEVLKEI